MLTTPRHAPQEPVFHPVYLRFLCALLRSEGGDVTALLAEAGLTEDELADDRRRLPLATVRWLIVALQRHAPRPTLGLEAGERLPLDTHGTLGRLLVSAPTLRDSVALLVRFMPLRTGVFQPRLEPVARGLRYVVEPMLALGEVARFANDHLAASNCRLLHAVHGGELEGAVLELPWQRPAWHRAYEALAPTVRWRAPALALLLPDVLLDSANPHADALAHAEALRRCEAAAAGAGGETGIVERVRVQLRAPGSGGFALAVVAAALGVSARTLVRRLDAEGTSFRVLVDEERKHRAAALLRLRRVAVADVALALGYRSASNFARSFKRWFGCAPGDWVPPG